MEAGPLNCYMIIFSNKGMILKLLLMSVLSDI